MKTARQLRHDYRELWRDTLLLLEAVPDDAHCSVRVRDAKERIRQRMAPLPKPGGSPEPDRYDASGNKLSPTSGQS